MFSGAVNRDLDEIREKECPQIIHASDMIGMGMGDQHRVDTGVSGGKKLVANVRPGIHKEIEPVFLNKKRTTLTPVFGIVRITFPPSRRT